MINKKKYLMINFYFILTVFFNSSFDLMALEKSISTESYIFDTKWGANGKCNGEFNYPSYITLDLEENIYVSDSMNNRIQKFNSEGKFITKWGTLGDRDGQFNMPYGITTDFNNNIYIADYNNNRIQKFNSEGKFITKWGTLGDRDGQFKNPVDISVDSEGNIYVLSHAYRLQQFNLDGVFLKYIDTYPYINVNTLFRCITIDALDNLLIMCWKEKNQINTIYYNSFVLKIPLFNNLMPIYIKKSSKDEQFNRALGIAADTKNNIYVADSFNNCIKKFDDKGNFITKWGSLGDDDGQFNMPSDITIDAEGNVYVVDSGNHRIQKFAPNPDYKLENPTKEE